MPARSDEYHRVLEGIASRSAEVAQQRAKVRALLRDDPSWGPYRFELSRHGGELRELNMILRKLQRRYDAESFDAQAFAEWLWHRHTQTNEDRSTTTGRVKEAHHGAHHASAEALRVLRSESGIVYEDYGLAEVA